MTRDDVRESETIVLAETSRYPDREKHKQKMTEADKQAEIHRPGLAMIQMTIMLICCVLITIIVLPINDKIQYNICLHGYHLFCTSLDWNYIKLY